MKIDLGPQWESIIRAALDTGRYRSADEVVEAGLRLFDEREISREIRLAELKAEIDVALEALDRGEYHEVDEQGLEGCLDDIDRRGHERLDANRPASM